ncbi:hypothetical protein ACFBZI_11675 [Moraxella sp. ZJ142]|uniref:hypothetical protein n=1 Tax=Moraxella marmotae TaxID=3344520 RepID=UPI0035D3FF5C
MNCSNKTELIGKLAGIIEDLADEISSAKTEKFNAEFFGDDKLFLQYYYYLEGLQFVESRLQDLVDEMENGDEC